MITEALLKVVLNHFQDHLTNCNNDYKITDFNKIKYHPDSLHVTVIVSNKSDSVSVAFVLNYFCLPTDVTYIDITNQIHKYFQSCHDTANF